MPLRSVARMIISPFFACSGLPFTSMLTRSSAITDTRAASGGLRSRSVADHAAAAVIDHVFELVAVVLEKALHRPRRGVTEGTDRMPLDAVGDIEQQAELIAPPLPGQHPLQHAVHPPGTLAARRALTAGLGHVEARDALQHAHHAGGLVQDDRRAGAERRACLLH